jgi:hypothetical protein
MRFKKLYLQLEVLDIKMYFMKCKILHTVLLLLSICLKMNAQTITYSQIDKADNKNLNFEIIGKLNGNYLVFKNLYDKNRITVYNGDLTVKNQIKLDFISDRASNIDFINYANSFLMIWQYEKKSTTYCNAVRLDGEGNKIGDVLKLDTTRTPAFANKIYYSVKWSEDKSKILVNKYYSRNDTYNLTLKVYSDSLKLLDSTRFSFTYGNRESFSDVQIDNDGGIVFTKHKENARAEYINDVEVYYKKLVEPLFKTVSLKLDKQLIQEPVLKIDNLNKNIVLNTFAYKKNFGYVEGLLTAIIQRDSLQVLKLVNNVFADSLRNKLTGNPDYKTAYENFFIKNVILKKDGAFIAITEEYTKQRRFGNAFDDRFNNGFNNGFYGNNFYGYNTDYYFFNRGNYGFYRPFNEPTNRDMVYNYNDIVTYSFDKNLKIEWNSVINKKTSDVETDNFLSFANMNTGSAINFLFLQKDNAKQILSNHEVKPDGTTTRLPTLKGRENGFYFMPKLSRQTGLKQILIPCMLRNNIAFAKIDF